MIMGGYPLVGSRGGRAWIAGRRAGWSSLAYRLAAPGMPAIRLSGYHCD